MTKAGKPRQTSQGAQRAAGLPPSDSPVRAQKTPERAHCDYCPADLGCDVESPLEREYFRLQLGMRACDACLPRVCDDFPLREARVLALRLRHAKGINLERIEEAIASASQQFSTRTIARLLDQQSAVTQLHSEGEFVASMHAGQALWNSVAHMVDAIDSRKARQAGMKSIEGGKKSAELRKKSNAPKDATKAARIRAAAAKYSGPADAMVNTIVKETGAGERYVRMVLPKEIRKSNS